MKHTHCDQRLVSQLAILIACGSMLTICTVPAVAGTIPAIDLINELMMENQGENCAVIGELIGPDPTSPLIFSSSVDLSSMAFSFALQPGSTYRGMSITLSGSGVFDAANDVWNASSSVTVSTTSWMVVGTYTGPVTGDPFLPPSNFVIFPGSHEFHDIHDLIFYDPVTGESGGFFHFTNIFGQRSTPNFPVTDHRNKDGTWSWDAVTDAFRVDSSGFSPIPNGGSGTFSTTISPIPEPQALLLFPSGLLIAAAGMARMRLFDRFLRK